MNETINILAELKLPFHPSDIEFKPGATSGDKTSALGLFYADLRAYQNRLDDVCGMDWSVTYTAWGDRIVCHLTIQGVTRSSIGEGDAQSEKSEIAGTAAEAQAFKRACSMFKLGRYLYEFPAVWAEFDGKKAFTPQGKAKLEKIVTEHYKRAMANIPLTGAKPERSPASNRFHAEGDKTYGKDWDNARHWLIERYTRKMTPTNVRKSAHDLSNDELDVLADAMVKSRDYYREEFAKTQQAQAVTA